MDQEIRNKLRNVVTQCRRLLEEWIAQELEGKYTIFAINDNVTADPAAPVTHLTAEERESRKDILDHFGHISARGFKPKDSLDQLVREIAFTHLNRLCAYKMMEAREVYVGGQKFRETVSRGVNSNGVKFYLAEHEEDERLFNTGHQDVAYRHYLDWLGGALSDEIGVLFNPNDPANRLYPRQKTLDEVLELLNEGGIKAEETELREQWPQIWSQDETIGWVYQYFTPKELRDQARKESSAPRNSYELAFRNQFFTPRYVVEFLTDNTLGRIWYEMRKGETKLKDQCRYMVRRPTEIFLKEGKLPPKDSAEDKNDLSQEELLKLPVHIPHRPKKDPRELKILDPACGSGHFLLYCFDLLLTIYEEAYADPNLGPALKKDYPTLDALKRDVPRLILANNLHGIDIDLRASQIAALALWLRCQRAYQEMELKKDRPKITRSNFVCAEPMPGEEQMLKEFVGQLEPKVLGQVVEVVFDKMKLAGEAGSLLKIEEEIRDAIREAKRQYEIGGISIQRTLFDKPSSPVVKVFSVKDITDAQFFEGAEAQVIEALRSYAEKAHNGQRLQRRLFTDDAVRGFAFVDLCQKRYDVVLMNPPFGEASDDIDECLSNTYPTWNKNLLCAFLQMGIERLNTDGAVGAIYDRTAAVKTTYEDFRRYVLLSDKRLAGLADLGWEVLDANVEVTTSVLHNRHLNLGTFLDVRAQPPLTKGECLASLISQTIAGEIPHGTYLKDVSQFLHLPNAVLGYDLPSFVLSALSEGLSLSSSGYVAYTGHQFRTEKHFRLWWEVSPSASPTVCDRLFNGAGFTPYTTALRHVLISDLPLDQLERNSTTTLRNRDKHLLPGLCFGKRGEFFCCHVLPQGHYFSLEGLAIPVPNKKKAIELLSLLNTPLARLSVNKFCGQHKTAGYVNLIPVRKGAIGATAVEHVGSAIVLQNNLRQCDETQPVFSTLCLSDVSEYAKQLTQKLTECFEATVEAETACHRDAMQSYHVPHDERIELDRFRQTQPRPELPIEDADVSTHCNWFAAHSAVSHAIGVLFGRWDSKSATCMADAVNIDGCFDELPRHPPAMHFCGASVDGEQGQNVSGPEIAADGILVYDEAHRDDVVARVQHVFERFGKSEDTLDAIEAGTESKLRDYFQRASYGGFWADHISRYSKSRRKAPIYWLLQSSDKNYALWLYYHRLDKDLLFKALVNYVEPKIRLEEDCLKTLLAQQATKGESGKEAKRLAKEVERQDEFLKELRDFEDKLRRAANLHLEPDLNDGVVLNIAPLWELVPWEEVKEYWDELLEGQYEWSSIGKQLRQKGLVK